MISRQQQNSRYIRLIGIVLILISIMYMINNHRIAKIQEELDTTTKIATKAAWEIDDYVDLSNLWILIDTHERDDYTDYLLRVYSDGKLELAKNGYFTLTYPNQYPSEYRELVMEALDKYIETDE